MTDEIITKLDDHIHRFEDHVGQFSDFEAVVMNQWADLLDILEGPEHHYLDGTSVRRGGVLKDVRDIKKTLSNGGVKIRIPFGAWVAIFVAVISGVFTVVAALV